MQILITGNIRNTYTDIQDLGIVLRTGGWKVTDNNINISSNGDFAVIVIGSAQDDLQLVASNFQRRLQVGGIETQNVTASFVSQINTTPTNNNIPSPQTPSLTSVDKFFSEIGIALGFAKQDSALGGLGVSVITGGILTVGLLVLIVSSKRKK